MISYNNLKPLTYDELIKAENKIHRMSRIEKNTIPEDIDDKLILSRSVKHFQDKIYNLPENIFILSGNGIRQVVGRKTLSSLYFSKKINALNCNRIRASMLLGYLDSCTRNEKDVLVSYFPFTTGEKLKIFDSIKNDRQVDIYYPFNHESYKTNREICASSQGWNLSPEKIDYLGYGEKHVRAYTSTVLEKYLKNAAILYDPACSTGQFLNDIKSHYPKVYTIGHDLSASMIEYAKQYLDESMVVDARNSPVKKASVDILFLRFLNARVVVKNDAYGLFDFLVEKVKPGGLVVYFGHTPTLIQQEYFLERGFKILQNNGLDKRTSSVFQYYVLEKPKCLT
jgi:hypothetical protein